MKSSNLAPRPLADLPRLARESIANGLATEIDHAPPRAGATPRRSLGSRAIVIRDQGLRTFRVC